MGKSLGGIALIASAFLLAGCAASTPEPPATYSSVVELRDAFVEAGGECPSWEQTGQIPLAAESGVCSGSNVLSIYLTQADRDELVTNFKSMKSGNTLLVGENWIINDPGVVDLQAVLGGTLVTS